jgi:hypothetical protein
MKMKQYTGTVSTNKVGSECRFWFEMPEDATEEEIEHEAFASAMERVEWNYKEDK